MAKLPRRMTIRQVAIYYPAADAWKFNHQIKICGPEKSGLNYLRAVMSFKSIYDFINSLYFVQFRDKLRKYENFLCTSIWNVSIMPLVCVYSQTLGCFSCTSSSHPISVIFLLKWALPKLFLWPLFRFSFFIGLVCQLRMCVLWKKKWKKYMQQNSVSSTTEGDVDAAGWICHAGRQD